MKDTKYKVLLKLLGLFLGLGLFAQEQAYNLKDPILDPASVIPPAPTVSNLIDFEEIPVNYYTGQPDITVPLFSKSIHKDLVIDLKLGYSSNGVKIDNRSGWLGTGWSLSGLGVVSKTVNGVPDESKTSYARGIWHDVPGDVTRNQEDQWKIFGENGKKWDGRYDTYHAVYPGGSVEFIIKANAARELTAVITKSSGTERVHIDHSYDTNVYSNQPDCEQAGHQWVDGITRNFFGNEVVIRPPYCANPSNFLIDGFTIIDGMGKRFVFDVFETTTATPINASIPQGPQPEGSISAEQVSNFYITRTAWHLTKIYSGPTEDSKLLDIEYDSDLELSDASIATTTNVIDFDASGIRREDAEVGYNKGVLRPAREISFFYSYTNAHKPSRINFRDGIQVEIVKEDTYAHPETGGAVIKSLNVYDRAGELIKSTAFSHTITTANNRLWLEALNESNSDHSTVLTHRFDYRNKSELPAFNSPKDIWGFIFPASQQTIGTSSDPIQTGLLTSITYPTGGKKEFTWEQHRFSYAGTERYDPETQDVDNPRNWVRRTQKVEAKGQFSAEDGTFLLFKKDFSLPPHRAPEVTLIHFEVTPVDPMKPPFDENNSTFRVIKAGTTSDIVFQQEISDFRADKTWPGQGITAGDFTAGVMVLNNNLYNVDIAFFITYEVLVTTPTTNEVVEKWIYGGGPRIKSIAFTDDNATQRNWSFTYNDVERRRGYSSGVIDGRFANYRPGYSTIIPHFLTSTDGVAPNERTVRYTITSDQANVKMTNGSYVGYKHVRVNEAGKGYTIYKYTTPASHPSPNQEFAYPFHKDDEIDNYRGALTVETQYQEFIVRDSVLLFGDPVLDDGTPDEGDGTGSSEYYQQRETPMFFPKKSTRYEYQYEVLNGVKDYLVTPTYNCASFQFYQSHQANVGAYISSEACESNCPPESSLHTCATPFHVRELDHRDIWRKLVSKKTNQFEYENDLISQKTFTVVESYNYNPSNRLVSEKKTRYRENDQEVEDRLNYYYASGPYPQGIFSSNEQAQINTNARKNRVADLIFLEGSEVVRNEGDVSPLSQRIKGQKKVTYANLNNGVYELSETSSRKSVASAFKTDVEVLKVDDFGNILEYQTADGLTHVHLYGYQGSVILATIENAAYDQAISGINTSALTNPPATPAGRQAIKEQLELVRSNLNSTQAFVTTYHYNSKMQLDEIIDPNDRKSTFYYDDFGRLLHTVDHEGNLVKEHTYRFRN